MDGVIFEIVSHQYPTITGRDMNAVATPFYPYKETKFAGEYADLSFQFHQYPAIVGLDMNAVATPFYPYKETKFAGEYADFSFQFHQYPAIVGVDMSAVATPFYPYRETKFPVEFVDAIKYYLYLYKIEGTAIGAEGTADIRLLNKRTGAYLDRVISDDGAYKFMGMPPTDAYLVYAIDLGKDANVIMRQAIVEECPGCIGSPSPF